MYIYIICPPPVSEESFQTHSGKLLDLRVHVMLCWPCKTCTGTIRAQYWCVAQFLLLSFSLRRIFFLSSRPRAPEGRARYSFLSLVSLYMNRNIYMVLFVCCCFFFLSLHCLLLVLGRYFYAVCLGDLSVFVCVLQCLLQRTGLLLLLVCVRVRARMRVFFVVFICCFVFHLLTFASTSLPLPLLPPLLPLLP